MKNPVATAFKGCLSLKYRPSQGGIKEGMLSFYVQVVNHKLELYETEHIIAEGDTEVMRFNQPEKHVATTLRWCPRDEDIALSTSVR